MSACTATKWHDAAISSSYGPQEAEPSPPPITHTICAPHVPCPLDAYVFQTAELHAEVPQYSHSGGGEGGGGGGRGDSGYPRGYPVSVSQSIYDDAGFHPERLASGHTLGTSTSATHSAGRGEHRASARHSASCGQIISERLHRSRLDLGGVRSHDCVRTGWAGSLTAERIIPPPRRAPTPPR